METHAFGFRLLANAPEGPKRFRISHLIECIRDDKRPVPTGEHARHVVEVTEKAYRSAETGQVQTRETTVDG